MTFRFPLALTLSVALVNASPIFAANAETPSNGEPPPIVLQDTTVQGDYIEIEAISSTKNITIITKDQIQDRGYESLSEALDDVPGINVGKSGYGEIDIRGQGSRTASRNVQIMMDGAPIGILTQHPYKTDYNIIPIDQIEKIEIIEGGGAVLYGSGTAGGVVNITSNLKGMKKPQSSVGYEYESENKHRYFVNLGAQPTEKLIIQANYSGENSDLYFVDTYKKTQYAGFGGAYRISDTQMLSMKYSHFEEEGKYVFNVNAEELKKYGKDYVPEETRVTVGYDPLTNKAIYEYRPRYNQSDRESDGFKVAHSVDITKNLSLMTDLVWQKGSYRNSHYEDRDMDYDSKGVKMKLSWDYLPFNKLLVGIDRIGQNATLLNPNYRKETRDRFDYKKEISAIFLHNKNRLGAFEFTQGVRFDHTDWITDKPEGQGSKFTGTQESRKSVRQNQAYELSGAWLYSDTGRTFLRWERGFTTPDGVQMTDAIYDADKNGKLFQNTGADDEIYNTYEIGMRDYIGNLFLAATAYLTETDNELNRISITDTPSLPIYRWDTRTLNLLETRRYGIDLKAEETFGRLRLTQGYSWAKGKTKYNSRGKALIESGRQIDWTDSGLQKVPEHKVVLTADYDITPKLTAGVAYKYTGSYANYYNEEDKPEDDLVDSYDTTDINLTYKMDVGLTLHAGINNLFDETYYIYNHSASSSASNTVQPAYGRTWYAGAKYTF